MSGRRLVVPLSVWLLSLACNFLLPTEQPPIPKATLQVTSLPATVIVEPTSFTFQTQIPASEADVPRVSLEKARAALESGTAIAVDVRTKEQYLASHIPGALSIPVEEIEANPNGLNLGKDEWIITYCT